MDISDHQITPLETARQWTHVLLEDLTDDEFFRQPGIHLQSAAWIIGHLTWAEWGLIAMRGHGQPAMGEPYHGMFGRGSTPGDGKGYPSRAELMSERERIHRESLPLLRALTGDRLSEPIHGDPHPMMKTKADILTMVAMHEAFHAGQLALLRRLMGKPPKR